MASEDVLNTHFGQKRPRRGVVIFLTAVIASVLLLGAGVAYRKFIYVSPEEKARIELQQTLAKRMEAHTFTDPETGVTMPYRLYVPTSEASSGARPLILAMHSGAGRADDNLRQLDASIEYLLSDALQGIEPVYVLAPQADRWTHWVDYPSFDPPFTNFDQREIPESDNVKTAIHILRDVIQRYDVDPARVYITGISMGGEGTWDAISYYPELFAAALPLNGAGDPRAMNNVKDLPIRFFHGSEDTITPVANSRELAQALQAIGANAQYQELEGAGHDIRSLVYGRELFAWLLKQKKQD